MNLALLHFQVALVLQILNHPSHLPHLLLLLVLPPLCLVQNLLHGLTLALNVYISKLFAALLHFSLLSRSRNNTPQVTRPALLFHVPLTTVKLSSLNLLPAFSPGLNLTLSSGLKVALVREVFSLLFQPLDLL